jgi:ribosome-associated protein
MKTTDFILNREYIELIRLLKLMRIAQSGAHAKWLVEDGRVTVNNRQEKRKRAKLREGDRIEIAGYQITIKGSEG